MEALRTRWTLTGRSGFAALEASEADLRCFFGRRVRCRTPVKNSSCGKGWLLLTNLDVRRRHELRRWSSEKLTRCVPGTLLFLFCSYSSSLISIRSQFLLLTFACLQRRRRAKQLIAAAASRQRTRGTALSHVVRSSRTVTARLWRPPARDTRWSFSRVAARNFLGA